MNAESPPLARIVGQQLSAVVFVQDYLQFQFDGPTLNLYTSVSVRTHDGVIVEDHAIGWRDALCAQITFLVRAIRQNKGELIVEFTNGAALLASLRSENIRGPEAGELIDDNVIVVIEYDAPDE